MKHLIYLLMGWIAISNAARGAADNYQIHLAGAATQPISKAVATAQGLRSDIQGARQGKDWVFTPLLADVAYDLRVELADGTIFQGVDLGWYTPQVPKADAEPLSEQDRRDMDEICTVPSFYDQTQILMLRGTHERAVGLVQLVRERDFHAGNGQVIWRVELWYFQFQAGGWERISQAQRVLRRERLTGLQAFSQATQKLQWVQEWGGLKLSTSRPALTVPWPGAQAAATAPSESESK